MLAANILATANAALQTPSEFREIRMTVETPDAPAGSLAALMIHVDPTSTSNLDPAAAIVQIDNATNTPVVSQVAINDASNRGSLTVVQVPAGSYIVRVADEGTQTGGFVLNVSLVGDLFLENGVRGSISDFESLYASAALAQSMGNANFVTYTYYQSRGIDMSQNLYDSGLDANNDGRIMPPDVAYVTTNSRAGDVQVTILADFTAPAIEARLATDTGSSNSDRITTDPTITGTVTEAGMVTAFEGRLDNGSFTNLLGRLANGTFTLDRAQMNALAGGTLTEGSHALELRATDDTGNQLAPPFSLSFVFISQNATPTVTAVPAQNATEDQAFSLNVSNFFSDSDPGDVLRFSLGPAAPAWLSINPTTGVLSGTPANSDVGNRSVTVIGTDSQGAAANGTVSITVANVNDPPVVENIPNQQASAGVLFSLDVGNAVSDPDAGDTVTISVFLADGFNPDGSVINQRPLPSWLTFNAATGILSGTPATADIGSSLPVAVLAVDAAGSSANDRFTLNVIGSSPPVSQQIPNQTVVAGSPFNFSISSFFTDPDNDPLTYSLLLAGPNGTLPAWMSFNAATGVISGTPAAGDVGTITLIAQANDAAPNPNAPRTFTLTILSSAQVRFSLRTEDLNGNPISTITPGGTFVLVGVVQDISPSPTGVFSAFLDVTFSTGRAAPTSGRAIVHSTTYSAGTSGSISAGLLDEVGGSDGFTPLGGNEFEVFSLEFTAGQNAGTVTFSGDPAEDTLLHPVLRFGGSANVPNNQIDFRSTTITIGSIGAPLSARVSSFGTNSENRYDVNGDKLVTPLDALLVINQLSAADPLGTGFVDVNADGSVTPLDALLVINNVSTSANRAAMSSGWTRPQEEDSSPADAVYDAVFANGEF
jgi:hypothetical protein